MKLRLGNNYQNKLNPSNKLALFAVNVLGFEFHPNDINHLRVKKNSDDDLEVPLASITDDLSYCMYVEESIVDMVKQLESIKHRAVEDERFEYARKIKLSMNCLRNAGERLGRYSLSKRLAVLKEDFTTANLRKEQMEIYKKLVYEKLDLDKLFELEGLLVENDICSEIYRKPQLPPPPTLVEVAKFIEDSRNQEQEQEEVATKSILTQFKQEEIPQSPQLRRKSSPRNSPTTGSLRRRRNKSAPRNSNLEYDDREIRTLRQ